MAHEVDLGMPELSAELFEVISQVTEVVRIGARTAGATAPAVVMENEREVLFERLEVGCLDFVGAEGSTVTEIDGPTTAPEAVVDRHAVGGDKLRHVSSHDGHPMKDDDKVRLRPVEERDLEALGRVDTDAAASEPGERALLAN
jgi:hypothetical protein